MGSQRPCTALNIPKAQEDDASDRATVGERRRVVGERAELGDELSPSLIGDRLGAPQTVARGNGDVAREDDEHPRPALPRLEQELAVGESARGSEAADPRDLGIREHWKCLVGSPVERARRGSQCVSLGTGHGSLQNPGEVRSTAGGRLATPNQKGSTAWSGMRRGTGRQPVQAFPTVAHPDGAGRDLRRDEQARAGRAVPRVKRSAPPIRSAGSSFRWHTRRAAATVVVETGRPVIGIL
jgi:hypothetical protein